MKLKDLVPLRKHQKIYEIAFINLYLQEHVAEFNINEEVYEGLEKSYPRQDVIFKLKTKFHLYVYDDIYDSKNILIRLKANDSHEIQGVLQFITQQGWFISNIETEKGDFKGNNPTAINQLLSGQYEQAILTIEATHGVEPETPKLLYHATPTMVWRKIQRTGLSPKTKSTISYHPERIYFTTTIQSAVDIAQEMAKQKIIAVKTQQYDLTKFNPEQYYKNWSILEIDTSKIPHIKGLSYFRVHIDPNVSGKGPHAALYSQNYIPPTAIKVVKQFDVF
ncbi:MAG: hypothetical protein ACREAU_01305 [Nitrosopumilaceae archaeon]